MSRAPRSARVALLAGCAGACAAAGLGWIEVASLCLLAGLAAGVVPIDVRERRIPTELVELASVATLVVVLFEVLDEHRWLPAVNAVGGALVAGGALLIVHLVQPRGLGFGDVRLGALVGA